MAIPHKNLDWENLRKAYVEREIQPTYTELSEEFGGTVARIGQVSTAESWGMARAARIEKRLSEANAGQVILKAITGDQTLAEQAKNTALALLKRLGELAEGCDTSKADSTRADVLNNISFALNNTCNALKALGVVGISKTLDQAGKEDNGRWNPQMLSQINLTVQNLVGQAKEAEAAKPSAGPVNAPIDVTPGGPVADSKTP